MIPDATRKLAESMGLTIVSVNWGNKHETTEARQPDGTIVVIGESYRFNALLRIYADGYKHRGDEVNAGLLAACEGVLRDLDRPMTIDTCDIDGPTWEAVKAAVANAKGGK